ncbi:unnamed protein product [Caenorhabditis auriculariae]|uniref:ubiquitinyl hydrolase 1 n=1 Tax=Caenorhabditis auriculariae TaxID=2777116 RepID=A0A8S1H3C7_9PELO|nr:unnamed protein product [Caenorhabditis auriculariae]
MADHSPSHKSNGKSHHDEEEVEKKEEHRPKRSRKADDEDGTLSKKSRRDSEDHEKKERSSRDDRKSDRDREKEKEKDREREKDRSSRKDKDKDRRRSSRSPKRRGDDKDKRSQEGEKAAEVIEIRTRKKIVEGEVREPPKPLTARELERKRLIEEELMSGKYPEDDDEPVWSMRKAQEEKASRSCPYLDTIDRSVLDFDFEKLCSVSLSHLNVYACMVCGKYFQGRGTNTHAYTHALDTDHRDIKYVLKPTYTKALIGTLDKQTRMARAYDDVTYFPGVVGLNNIKANDYSNVVLHALSHVGPLRDYFLREENYANIRRPPGDKLTLLPMRFGEVIRKLWNPRAFRTHVSPHEMLQAVVVCSNKKFQFIKQSDAADYLTFLLNTLHTALNGNQKTNSSIVYKTFRGKMRQYSRKVVPAEDTEEEKVRKLQMPEYQETVTESPFLFLTLDLPPPPLYRDVQMQNIIPQVPLHVLLEKFNGQVEKEYKTYKDNIMKRFELLKLPDFLIITYKRFQKNQWFVEKNPTIVNFPIINVDLFDCLADDVKGAHKFTTYDLVANIVHEGKYEDGSYRVQLVHQVISPTGFGSSNSTRFLPWSPFHDFLRPCVFSRSDLLCEKPCEDIVVPHLVTMFNESLANERAPQSMPDSVVRLLHKKGNCLDIGNYRPVALLSVVYKLFTSILRRRATRELEAAQPIEQTGFRSGFSTSENTLVVTEMIQKSQEYKFPLYLMFVDYKKAFDSVEFGSLWTALSEFGVHSKIVMTLKNIYEEAEVSVRIRGQDVPVRIQKGVRQGDTISPDLFNATLEHIFEAVPTGGSGKWFELEDLHVKDMLPQMIVLAESYIQVWRLNKEKTREERAQEGVDMMDTV